MLSFIVNVQFIPFFNHGFFLGSFAQNILNPEPKDIVLNGDLTSNLMSTESNCE